MHFIYFPNTHYPDISELIDDTNLTLSSRRPVSTFINNYDDTVIWDFECGGIRSVNR